jgi:hypothetical protein
METAVAPPPLTQTILPAPVASPPPQYNLAIGYLRAWVTLMVLAHHAVLAYCTFAPPPPRSLLAQPRWWGAFPVVDVQRSNIFSVFVLFNDRFFMALMFFLSGLFVWSSLERKGSKTFLRDRGLRLGIPFIVAAAVIAPLAYYPTYLQIGGRGVAGYWAQWSALRQWPAGPAWFVWLLLAFDLLAAAIFVLAPHSGDLLRRCSSGAARRPVMFFSGLFAAAALAYLPLALRYGPLRWTTFGPFYFQTSRLLLYLVYFFAGVTVGAYSLGRGLLAAGGNLARRYPLWILACALAFLASLSASTAIVKTPTLALAIVAFVAFVLSGAASSFAFLACFVRFVKRDHRVFDSLRDNAYGMYLVHYVFVSWLQYALLRSALPALAKGSLVFAGTVLLSWAAVAGLRRIPAVARVI